MRNTEEAIQLITGGDAEGTVRHDTITVATDKYGTVCLQVTKPILTMLPSQARKLARALTAAAKGA